MTVQIRDADGTVRLSGDLLAPNGATGDVLTQQADGTYAPAAGAPPGTPTLADVLTSGGDPDGNPITGAVAIESDGASSASVIITADAGEPPLVLQNSAQVPVFDVSDKGTVNAQVLDGGSWGLQGSDFGATPGNSDRMLVAGIAFNGENGGVGNGGELKMQDVTSAPADASIAAGGVCFWLDATNGAAKLMIKAKTADGTVATGSVTLT